MQWNPSYSIIKHYSTVAAAGAAYHSITYTKSAQHYRKHSTYSMYGADAAAAAPAADQDSFSTSSTSAQPRHEQIPDSGFAHITPHGAPPVLHTLSGSPHAAQNNALPGVSDDSAEAAAVTSHGDQKIEAAGAHHSPPSDNRAATQGSTWDAAAVDDGTDTYDDNTCSTQMGSAGLRQAGGIQHRAETWIVQVCRA
jgi:hypothetical protein